MKSRRSVICTACLTDRASPDCLHLMFPGSAHYVSAGQKKAVQNLARMVTEASADMIEFCACFCCLRGFCCLTLPVPLVCLSITDRPSGEGIGGNIVLALGGTALITAIVLLYKSFQVWMSRRVQVVACHSLHSAPDAQEGVLPCCVFGVADIPNDQLPSRPASIVRLVTSILTDVSAQQLTVREPCTCRCQDDGYTV